MNTKIITPGDVVKLDDEFAEQYHDAVISGMRVAEKSRVVVVGLARQIAEIVPLTKGRLEVMSELFGEFEVVVVENDSTDGTPDLFREWEPGFNVTVESQSLDRPHLPASREADRTRPLAEYRQRCVQIVSEMDEMPDYVIVMDYDSWGGFLNEGILTSLHYLDDDPHARFGMASLGLAQIPQIKTFSGECAWIHYDAWAYRPVWSWRQRPEMWVHYLVPPLGCPPIEVASAFGGLAVYRTEDYLLGRYSGTLFGAGDCEHVAFHRSIYNETGKVMYLNPSSVGVMFWQPEQQESNAAAA